MGAKDALDREEMIGYVMSCWDHEAHLVYTEDIIVFWRMSQMGQLGFFRRLSSRCGVLGLLYARKGVLRSSKNVVFNSMTNSQLRMRLEVQMWKTVFLPNHEESSIPRS